MNIRLAIILSGTLLVSAAGGLVATWPAIRAADEASVPVDRAPTPELDADRRAVLASLASARAAVAARAEQLELLAALMAESGDRSNGQAARAPDPVTLKAREDPVGGPR